MCNALYPIYDTHNVSNFVFAALEWANNMLQSWTNCCNVATAAGSGDSAQLARQSKTTSGRKKAIILLVNKPDWFEPNEMTYLGFDNDFSEVPVIESDKIDFSINYGDTSKKFLDGTSYNGTIQGPKKLIRFEKYSGDAISSNGSCPGSATCRLYIPRQARVRLKVRNINSWSYYP